MTPCAPTLLSASKRALNPSPSIKLTPSSVVVLNGSITRTGFPPFAAAVEHVIEDGSTVNPRVGKLPPSRRLLAMISSIDVGRGGISSIFHRLWVRFVPFLPRSFLLARNRSPSKRRSSFSQLNPTSSYDSSKPFVAPSSVRFGSLPFRSVDRRRRRRPTTSVRTRRRVTKKNPASRSVPFRPVPFRPVPSVRRHDAR